MDLLRSRLQLLVDVLEPLLIARCVGLRCAEVDEAHPGATEADDDLLDRIAPQRPDPKLAA